MMPTSSQVRRSLWRPAGACWWNQHEPAAIGSVFRPGGVINPVLGLFVGPTGNGVALPVSAECGRTAWIAVRMRIDLAGGTAMVSEHRPIMICFSQRDGAEERKPGGQCCRRKFHDFIVHVA